MPTAALPIEMARLEVSPPGTGPDSPRALHFLPIEMTRWVKTLLEPSTTRHPSVTVKVTPPVLPPADSGASPAALLVGLRSAGAAERSRAAATRAPALEASIEPDGRPGASTKLGPTGPLPDPLGAEINMDGPTSEGDGRSLRVLAEAGPGPSMTSLPTPGVTVAGWGSGAGAAGAETVGAATVVAAAVWGGTAGWAGTTDAAGPGAVRGLEGAVWASAVPAVRTRNRPPARAESATRKPARVGDSLLVRPGFWLLIP